MPTPWSRRLASGAFATWQTTSMSDGPRQSCTWRTRRTHDELWPLPWYRPSAGWGATIPWQARDEEDWEWRTFRWVASRWSDRTDQRLDLVAASASGDLVCTRHAILSFPCVTSWAPSAFYLIRRGSVVPGVCHVDVLRR